MNKITAIALIYISFMILPLTTSAADRIFIPTGPFCMGYSIKDIDCASDEGPGGGIKAQVAGFYLDKYEVSVGEYRQCMCVYNMQ